MMDGLPPPRIGLATKAIANDRAKKNRKKRPHPEIKPGKKKGYPQTR